MLAAASLAADEGRYVGIYEDGSTITVDKLHGSLATPPLTRGSYPLRLVRDLQLKSELRGPHIRLANGDIVPGQVTGRAPARPGESTGKRMIVAIAAPLASATAEAGKLEIRIDRIARIVPADSLQTDMQPGTLWLSGDRPVRFEAVKWGADALTVLTDTGTIRAGYDELREYHAKNVDPRDALLDDCAAPSSDPESPLVRIQMRNGTVITCRSAELVDSFQQAQQARVLAKPTWAPDGVIIDAAEVVCCSYRPPSEVPLSLLGAATLALRSFAGFSWPWRRNENVRGDELRSGTMLRALGIGMHSHTAVAFELPPGAREFTSWVGLDRAVGQGGCVKCSVYGDAIHGAPLWQSGYLRGSDGPVRIAPVQIEGIKRLILVADFAHEGRPDGADPVDIRDEVDWLGPTVKLAAAPAAARPPAVVPIPELKDWETPAEVRKGPFWHNNNYTTAIYVKAAGQIRFKRRFTVSPSNSLLQVSAGCGPGGAGGHDICVYVNGAYHPAIGYGEKWPPVRNRLITERRFRHRRWGLGKFAGRDVLLEVVMYPVGEPAATRAGWFFPGAGSSADPPEVIFGCFAQRPVVGNLSAHGGLVTPAVPLSSLKPQQATLPVPGARLQPGRVTDGKPLAVCTYPFEDGYGVPGGSELTYGLDQKWTRFVAVIGWISASNSTAKVGPFQILLDGRTHWESKDAVGFGRGDGARHVDVDVPESSYWKSSAPDTFGRRDTARQIDVEIPKGHKTITLRLPPGETCGAWANAGFMGER